MDHDDKDLQLQLHLSADELAFLGDADRVRNFFIGRFAALVQREKERSEKISRMEKLEAELTALRASHAEFRAISKAAQELKKPECLIAADALDRLIARAEALIGRV